MSIPVWRLAAVVLLCAAVPAWAADDVAAHLDAARAAQQKADLLVAAHETELALKLLHDKLGRLFAETLPAMGGRWKAEEVEIDSLGEVGGGLSITRAYTRDDSSLNISLLLDSPEVAATQAMLAAPPVQPNLKKIKVGGEDALLRFDSGTGTGEITLVVAGRVQVEIQGDNISGPDPLVEAANGCNLSRLKALLSN